MDDIQAVKVEALPVDLHQLLSSTTPVTTTTTTATTTTECSSSQPAIHRWKSWNSSIQSTKQNSLKQLYENDRPAFNTMMEPLALFSPYPEEWALECATEQLIGQIDVNELPIRPSAKGECLLLPQVALSE